MNFVSVTEMLPNLNQMWLPDTEDRRYTSEFRLVAVAWSDRTSPSRLIIGEDLPKAQLNAADGLTEDETLY